MNKTEKFLKEENATLKINDLIQIRKWKLDAIGNEVNKVVVEPTKNDSFYGYVGKDCTNMNAEQIDNAIVEYIDEYLEQLKDKSIKQFTGHRRIK